MNSIPLPAAQIIISIIPIVGISAAAAVVFFWLFWHHRRTTLLIKSGIYQKPEFNLQSFSLLTGLLLASIGLVLTILLAILEGKSYSLLGGAIPLACGVALLVFYGVGRHETKP